MYRGRFWTMRQYAGFATAAESNERYKYLLSQGTTGLSVAFDLPTQMGLDSDDQLAAGEVGKVGVAIDSLDDMLTLFDGIPLDQVTTSMTINATASTLLCLYLAVARKQGVAFDKVGGTIQNDILKEYVARGTYIYPPKPSLRLITDTFAFCAARGAELEHDFHIRVITFARPARPRHKRSHSRSPTASLMCRQRSMSDLMSISLHQGSPSFSTRTITLSKRSRSFVQPGGLGWDNA